MQDLSGPSTPSTNRQSDFTITPHKAADSATSKLAVVANTETEAGKGELNSAATWDDFPNGRFGDYKSPAYGDPNPWGTSNVSVRPLPLLTRFT